MKVYAEYFKEKEIKFRRNTLLQFGNSWNLIGNVVLANPGSAEPLNRISNDLSLNLNDFYNSYREKGSFIDSQWFEFNNDSTMRFIEKIYNGFYVGKNIDLNGIIQLFNTFNIKNQNLSKAVNQVGTESDILFSRGVQKFFHDKPTYFGFSHAILRDKTLRKVAMDIFDNSSDKVRSIYKDQFSENSFYHPMYINRAHKKANFKSYKDQVLLPLLENI